MTKSLMVIDDNIFEGRKKREKSLSYHMGDYATQLIIKRESVVNISKSIKLY